MTVPAQSNYFAVIKVVGVGGGGVNAVNRMIDAGLQGCRIHRRQHRRPGVAHERCRPQAGHRASAHPRAGCGQRSRGRASWPPRSTGPRSKRRSRAPTWCSSPPARVAARGPAAAPVVAEIAKNLGALTIGVVTRPFTFEGRRRSVQADQGIQVLREKVDTLIIIPNDRLLTVSTEKTSMVEAFKMADEVLHAGGPGHHQPHHRARPHQHRLRRREDDHVQRRHRHHGHRLGHRRRTRRQRGTRRHHEPVARGVHRRGARASSSTSPADPTSASSKSTRRPRSSTASPTRTPTSSSGASSTTPWTKRSASR